MKGILWTILLLAIAVVLYAILVTFLPERIQQDTSAEETATSTLQGPTDSPSDIEGPSGPPPSSE